MKLIELREFIKATDALADNTPIHMDFAGYTANGEETIDSFTFNRYEDDCYDIDLKLSAPKVFEPEREQ